MILEVVSERSVVRSSRGGLYSNEHLEKVSLFISISFALERHGE